MLLEAQETSEGSTDEKTDDDSRKEAVYKEPPIQNQKAKEISDIPIPEKVVINEGDEKVDINIEKKEEKESGSKKKEQVKIGING